MASLYHCSRVFCIDFFFGKNIILFYFIFKEVASQNSTSVIHGAMEDPTVAYSLLYGRKIRNCIPIILFQKNKVNETTTNLLTKNPTTRQIF